MATLTADELRVIRNAIEKRVNGFGVNYTKAEINAAAQAIEDRLQGSKTILSNDIEAVAPGKFNVPQKKLILAYAALRFAAVEAS